MKHGVWTVALVTLVGLTGCSQNAAGQSKQAAQSTSNHASVKASGNSTGTNGVKTTQANAGSSTIQGSTNSTAAKVPKGPLPGDLLIADEGNSRILIVNPQKKVVWSMNLGFKGNTKAGADDSFLTPDQKHIIINEENNQVIAIIDIAKKKIVWQYGHPGHPGSKPGYLNTPDDAYQLPNGDVSVADIRNQRILFINPKTNKIVKQYGITGKRYHNPPYSFAAPNGDTPVSGGRTLVTEIGGSYADMLSPSGKLLYTVHFPNIKYPSDTQLLPNGNLLVVDYSKPGRVEEITPKGKIVWDYYKTSGNGALNHPSLAIRLPNGDIALNDDYDDRVVIINPKTNKIVWQYGHKGKSGTAKGFLNEPDGIDFVPTTVNLGN
ncbi:PQQ-binding-like beta-propeller repeat protein [Alicyclobacillus sp. SO9]|uniref:outer membrane protein assembly factor BamB family protein n=1 Tax=Alicyclobacillus sp. SO9 TaxID=2665646 RepID=UPI001E3A0DF4|nr:PQQ-binding-like beta-propeller repeat protein [Alicyclobacillus sp. SO9]